MEQYFLRMAGVVALYFGLTLAQIYLFRWDWLADTLRVLWLPLPIVAFMFAPYAVVVHGVHVHRAIAVSVRFAVRHLPALAALLVGVTVVQWALLQIGAPVQRPPSIDTRMVLRGMPAALLLMLFGLCVWGMMMQWYAESAQRELPGTAADESEADA